MGPGGVDQTVDLLRDVDLSPPVPLDTLRKILNSCFDKSLGSVTQATSREDREAAREQFRKVLRRAFLNVNLKEESIDGMIDLTYDFQDREDKEGVYRLLGAYAEMYCSRPPPSLSLPTSTSQKQHTPMQEQQDVTPPSQISTVLGLISSMSSKLDSVPTGPKEEIIEGALHTMTQTLVDIQRHVQAMVHARSDALNVISESQNVILEGRNALARKEVIPEELATLQQKFGKQLKLADEVGTRLEAVLGMPEVKATEGTAVKASDPEEATEVAKSYVATRNLGEKT